MFLTRPSQPLTPTVATISVVGKLVTVRFPEKREDFRLLIRSLGYEWNGYSKYWGREIGALAGEPRDRAAEAGRRILAAGFVVDFPDETLRQAAIDGSYRPECRRWVLVSKEGAYKGWFKFWWGREQDLYPMVIRLTGARYDKPYICVRPIYYAEVLDFAQAKGFQVHPDALALAQETERGYLSALIADINPGDMPVVQAPGLARPNSELPDQEIAGEFLDEPL